MTTPALSHDTDAADRSHVTPHLVRSLSTPGLLAGSLFFAASLAPSLVPRPFLVQGILSGCSFAAGYGLGSFLQWLWFWLGLRALRPHRERLAKIAGAAVCLTIVAGFLWRASTWQDSVRAMMGLDPVEHTRPLEVAAVAAGMFGVLIVFARILQLLVRLVSARLARRVPHRVSKLLAVVLVAALIWSILDGVLFRGGLRLMDASYQQVDDLVDPDVERPADPVMTGSAASLLDWVGLGKAGRDFIASAPSREELGEFLGADATQPVRVYVGLNSAESVEERAKLALAELVRTGGFDRSVLVIVTPTGTGWVDPGGIATLEYLHRGDVASVAMQYSYLGSWLALLVEPGYGVESARALFREVYGYWTRLPGNARPRLYLHGVSLGAMNSDHSADLWDVIADPFHGALWVGPPFTSATWQSVTSGRTPGSRYWLPTFRDNSVIRFFNQHGSPGPQNAPWGPMRIVYLQYASDPVTFFDPRSAWREPPWLADVRGPDVSPSLRWFPVVTLFHMTVDLALANRAPIGFGHRYAPGDFIEAWIAVTDPTGWTTREISRLKEKFSTRAQRERPPGD